MSPIRMPMHRAGSSASWTRHSPSPAGLSRVQIAISKFSAWSFRRTFWKRQLFWTSWCQWGAIASGSSLVILTCNSTWQVFLFPRPFLILCNFLPSSSSWFPLQTMYLPNITYKPKEGGKKGPDCLWWSNEVIAIILNIFKSNLLCLQMLWS